MKSSGSTIFILPSESQTLYFILELSLCPCPTAGRKRKAIIMGEGGGGGINKEVYVVVLV